MPFVKVSRDRRGYEQISLFHAFGRRGKPSKPRLLYVFRTPPGVKVGREPFDELVRRELEAQNPGVVFDWKKLSNIPVPALDVEYWRERRRADKAAKLARRAEEKADGGETESSAADDGLLNAEDGVLTAGDLEVGLEAEEDLTPVAPNFDGEVSAGDSMIGSLDPIAGDPTSSVGPGPEAPGGSSVTSVNVTSVNAEGRAAGHRRRRRRGGRRRRHGGARPEIAAAGSTTAPAAVVEPPAASSAQADPSKVPGDSSKEA